MSHFAKVNPENVVTRILVAEQDYIDAYIDTEPGRWIQTSYNTRMGVHYDPQTNQPSEDQSKALRKNFAGVGYTYSDELDAFIPPKGKNETTYVIDPQTGTWVPPIPKPDGDWHYDDATGQWVEPSSGTPT